jgi:ankyrin repeat protein
MLKKIFLIFTISIVPLLAYPTQHKISEQEVIKAIKGGLKTTKELLQKVPIDYVSPHSDTLLHYAVRFRKRKVVEYLVRQKILISKRGGPFYGTALQEAIYYGYLGIASYLIEKGTYLNIKNKYGETALHIAAKNGYLDIVEQLLEHGASKKITDENGNIPYDLIPDITWDSKKRLKELLRVDYSKQNNINPKNSNRYFYMGINRVEQKKNETINLIDKKSKIKNSDFGINIETERRGHRF